MFLLRLIIPDRPGSLGVVATALGEVNADIHAIEIVEHRRENGTAVDDIVVDLPPGVLPDRLVSACNSVADVEVIWFSRYGAGGGVHMDLEAVEQMTSAPADAIDILVEQSPAVLHADWAALLDGTGSEVKVALETSATPEFGDVAGRWLPLAKATTLEAPDHKGLSESVLVAAPAGLRPPRAGDRPPRRPRVPRLRGRASVLPGLAGSHDPRHRLTPRTRNPARRSERGLWRSGLR
ncbi:hypothetical protein JOF29_002197 [Kribbella aluminosa]|uniref:ACT domain-containing protein n=1 Tax=Kribbella aluminosa TaxID=416017 RepID=A0ABS4UHS2_9ACTN|nr:amino acid-binding protein [Kribbella aluminosa]MBP2351114.1 hypothetical protein [Kribbella aluminosa]